MWMNVNVTQLINNWFPALSLFAEQKPLTQSIIPTLCAGHGAKEVPPGVTFVDSNHHGNPTHLQPQLRRPKRCTVESCLALGTGLEFVELNSDMSNFAGKVGFFSFNFLSLSSRVNKRFWKPSQKRAFSDLKNKTLFFFLSPRAKNKDKVNPLWLLLGHFKSMKPI